MKFKAILFSFFLLLISNTRAQLIQGTLRSGVNDSIEVWIRPDFTNTTQYLFQLSFPIAFPATTSTSPASLNFQLSPQFKSVFGDNYSLTVNPIATNTANTEKYFNVVLIRTGSGASNPQSWDSGIEYKVFSAVFVPFNAPASQVKLADFQDGGSDGQGNFYTMDGNANYYVTSNSINNFYSVAGQSIIGGTIAEGFAQTTGNVPCTPPVVQPISGAGSVMLGQTTQLSNSTAGGTWTSDAPGIASIDANGVVTGVAAGNTTIRYSVTNACATVEVIASITVEQKLIAGTIRQGGATNEIEIWLKPYFTNNNTQYLFQIGLPIAYPATVNPQPIIPGIADITISNNFKSNFGENYTVFVNPLSHNITATENYFNVVLIRTGVNASIPQSWLAGEEYHVLTIKFTNPGALSLIKLADYQDGGSDGQGNFYTMDGNANYYVTDNSVNNFYASPGQSTVGGVPSAGYAQTIPAVAPVCTDPVTPTITNISVTGANIDWNDVNDAIGYEYFITTTPGAPGSGFNTSSSFYNPSNLLPGTMYYVYIRSNCAPGVFSNWVSANFATTCPETTTAAANNIGMTSATIIWQATPGATSYQIAITETNTIPVAWNQVSGTSHSVSNLIAGTSYYIHIRSVCHSGSFSSWTATMFTTVYPLCIPTFIQPVTPVGSTAIIKWTAFSGVDGYEYVVTTNPNLPQSGTFTTGDSYQATGLISATQYHVYVRVQCGPGRFSQWSTSTFTTSCFKPSLFVLKIPTLTGVADLGWNKIANSVKYEYAILGNELSPGGSSAFTTDTVIHARGLRPGGKYYLHVRSHCEKGSISAWSVLRFYPRGIEVYPNPASNNIRINLYEANTSDGEIEIFDAIGRVMTKVKLTGNTININIGHYASGVYFIRYSKENGFITRIIKK
jgi:hypothetical protein